MADSDFQVVRVTGEADRERLYRLRYDIFIKEQARNIAAADHARGMLVDEIDGIAEQFAVIRNGEMAAALRILYGADRLPPEIGRNFGIERFSHIPKEQFAFSSRLFVAPAHRGSAALFHLVQHCYQASRARGAKIDIMCCAPNLVRLYEQLGYRRYRPYFEDRAGLRIPMALIAGDVEHLKAVRSPLLPTARKLPDDPALSDWFQRTFADHRSFVSPVSVVSPVSLGDARFMEIVSGRIGEGAPALLEGLDKAERDIMLAAMTRSEMEAGPLTRRGDTGKEIFLILDGVAEARVRDERLPFLLATYGRGNILGEMAVISGKQSVDLIARTRLQIASFDEEGLDRFVKTQPAIAAKLLRNLPRVLAERLVVTSDQLATASRADKSPLTSAWSIWSVGPRDRAL